MPLIKHEKAKKFFDLALYQANLFSKDPNTKVGVIFLAPESLQILSVGYNGLPRKIEEHEYRWQRPQKLFYVSHAEMNGIANACRHGTPLENSIAIVTMFPCSTCAKLLIQAGICCIVSSKPRSDCPRWGQEHKYSLEMLTESGIEIIYIEDI